jgi:competence protein ComEC
MNKNIRTLLLLALIVIALIFFYQRCIKRKEQPQPTPGPIAGKLVVRFLNIGQGDSELLQLPDGQTILIDAGDNGQPTVQLLKDYGVQEIDLAIATHPHADHIGQMLEVMRAFKVKEFWDSGFTGNPTKTYRDMLAEIKRQGIKFAAPRQGETRDFGNVKLEVLHPSMPFLEVGDSGTKTNNASIVVRVTYGKERFLFTGDAEEASWRQMIDSESDKLRADLLKAAHHGSSNGTTKDVLDAVQPSIITISCAAGNDYHHPHPKVVNLLKRDSNIHVYRTDLEGTITAVCDGNTIDMSTEKQVDRAMLYATGDEVAGKPQSGDDNGGMDTGRRSRRSR